MAEGITKLEETINKFESALAEMKVATREAHEATKELNIVKREIQRLLSTNVKKMVEEETAKVVHEELDKIGPQLREYTSAIYDRVQREMDKIIDLSLGKEFSRSNGREDLRPQLAEKFREWLDEILWEK